MPFITLHGKTFEHRETIKAVGGKWDAPKKEWFVSHPTEQFLEWAEHTPGIVVTREDKPDAQPVPRNVAPLPTEVDPEITSGVTEGETKIFGDDQTYFNTFARKNPPSFSGFSSLGAMVEFVRNIDPNNANDRRGWIVSDKRSEFTGTFNIPEALHLASNGWQYGADKAAEAMEILDTDNPLRRERISSVAGGRVNVGKMLSGNPMHMTRRAKQPAHKNITLYVNAANAWQIEASDMIIRAACVGAMVDILESHDYSCDIVAFFVTENHFQIATRVKDAGETLNISDLVFALGHPSFFRRMGFAIAANAHCESALSTYGIPTNGFDIADLKADEMLVGKLHHEMKLKALDFKGRVREMFPLIVPPNFPVTLR